MARVEDGTAIHLPDEDENLAGVLAGCAPVAPTGEASVLEGSESPHLLAKSGVSAHDAGAEPSDCE